MELWKNKVWNMNRFLKLPCVNINWMYVYGLLNRSYVPLATEALADDKKFDYLLVCYSRAERIYGGRAYGVMLKQARYYFEKICRYANLELVLLMNNYEPCLITQQTLIAAAKNGNENLLKYLISKYNGNLDFSDSALIRVAAINNKKNIVKYLLEKYPYLDPTTGHTKFRYSCIFKVFDRNLREMMEILLTDNRVKMFINTSMIKQVAIKRGRMFDLLSNI
jgi:hypothetical protein